MKVYEIENFRVFLNNKKKLKIFFQTDKGQLYKRRSQKFNNMKIIQLFSIIEKKKFYCILKI